MRTKRFTHEQSISVLREYESGDKLRGPCRRPGMAESTCHARREKNGGMPVNEDRRQMLIEDESRRLTFVVAEPGLDLEMLKDVAWRRS